MTRLHWWHGGFLTPILVFLHEDIREWGKAVIRQIFKGGQNNMELVKNVELIISLIPKIEKIVSDAKAAEQTPQMQALLLDLEAVIAETKNAFQGGSK